MNIENTTTLHRNSTSQYHKVQVTAENFTRAETDMYFSFALTKDGFGKICHTRNLTPIDQQTVIRTNRDTLYSSGVFDLDAGPVTISLPDPGKRFMSMQIIDEDEYSHGVIYSPGTYTFTRDVISTRYFMVCIRILLNPENADDLNIVHLLQDAILVKQLGEGRFEIPDWDQSSQNRVRDALLVLGETLPDSKGMFGAKGEVDPVRFLIGAAMGWGGNPEKEATYVNVTPAKNDGIIPHTLTVKDVPVDGFWSVSVYNAKGFFQRNNRNVYSVNSLTGHKDLDGSISIQFGSCYNSTKNCIPIMPGWNYIVRLYRPRAEILKGEWRFPSATPI